MDIERIHTPPVLPIIDVMRATNVWPDHLSVGVFERIVLDGLVFGLRHRGEGIGFFLLHSLVPGVQVQEDLLIAPGYHGRWATRGAFSALREVATTTAFEGLGVERLVAYVDEENRPSRRLTEHLGMKCEGRLRHANRIRGEWRNTMLYSMLRDEA